MAVRSGHGAVQLHNAQSLDDSVLTRCSVAEPVYYTLSFFKSRGACFNEIQQASRQLRRCAIEIDDSVVDERSYAPFRSIDDNLH